MENSLENEFVSYLSKTISDGELKNRNIDIVASYYGCRDLSWPTLEQVGKQYGIDTRERVRQIIKNAMDPLVAIEKFPRLERAVDILQSKPYQNTARYFQDLNLEGIEWPTSNVRGLLDLMHEFKLAPDYDAYTPEFKRLTRGQQDKNFDILILKEPEAKSLLASWKAVMKFPGLLGIANLKVLAEQENWSSHKYYLLKTAIKTSVLAWFSEDGSDFWYMFENRDNTLLNYHKKVFSIIKAAKASHLAQVYENALHSRALTRFSYPPLTIIEKYLNGSVLFAARDGVVEYKGATESILPIESKTFDFLHKHDRSNFTSLSQYLISEGFNHPNVVKRMNSPLVYVDKSLGRSRYTFANIQGVDVAVDSVPGNDRYNLYLENLRSLMDLGTDVETDAKVRREQGLLQDWLFKDKEVEHCAICGDLFNVSALVAAHKKRRADCTAAERLDPYIVMPLCLFGCDFLYERGYCYIESGSVVLTEAKTKQTSESIRVLQLKGKKLKPEWVKGEDKGYFKKYIEATM